MDPRTPCPCRLIMAAILALAASARAELKLICSRLLEEAERSSVMVPVRNAGGQPLSIRDLRLAGKPAALGVVEANGRPVQAQVRGSPIPPGMIAAVELALAEPLKLAQDCCIHIASEAGPAAAHFRTHVAEALTYMFYGNHCDKRDLADGSTRELLEGPPADDFGHFGTDLCLAASRDGRRVFLADQAGRLYLHQPTR